MTALASSSVQVWLQKQAGSSYQKTNLSGSWFEIDAANMPGLYDVLLSSSDTNTVGFLKYYVSSTHVPYVGLLEIVARTSDEIYNLVETSSGAGSGATLVSQPGNTTTRTVDVGAAARVPVILVSSDTGLPVLNVLASSVSATVQKNDGVAYRLTVSSDNWLQVNTGSFSSTGLYNLVIDGNYTNQLGYLAYAVSVSGCDTYYDNIWVGEPQQNLSKVIGTPVVSIARDVAQIGKLVQGIDKKVS